MTSFRCDPQGHLREAIHGDTGKSSNGFWSGAQRILSYAAIVYGMLLSCSILYFNRAFYHDDAYITLRYARNLIQGNGLVWNPGEYVQGYTNLLHLLLISLLGKIGVDLVWASRIIGVTAFVCVLCVIKLFFSVTTGNEQERALWHLPMILTLTSAPMLVWSVGGLEGTLFSLLTSAGCLIFLLSMYSPFSARCHIVSALCFGLGALTRPDGLIFPFVSLIWLFSERKSVMHAWRRGLTFILSGAIIVVPCMLWQWVYYGDVVPNTFYAKASQFSFQRLFSGVQYVVAYALTPPYLPLLACISAFYALLAREWTVKHTYLMLSICSYTLFIITIGGDHMQAYRLLLPLVPLTSALVWMSLASTARRYGRKIVIVATVGLLVLASLQLQKDTLNPQQEDRASFVGTIVGKYIAEAWPSGSLVALNTAGSTPYYADRHRYIDMLGLNDRHIAKRYIETLELPWQYIPGHLKGDGRYVLSRRPDFIIIGPSQGTLVSKPWFLSDLEIARDHHFSQSYKLSQVNLDFSGKPVRENGLLFTYYRRTSPAR